MSQFNSYEDYQKKAAERAARQANSGNTTTQFAKVGFFKLKNDGDSALVRINYTKPQEFMFASYHQLGANTKYMKVQCIGDGCPFCEAAKNDTSISKAKERVFIPMMVAYRQPDGSYSAPEAVIMDAPAAGRNDYAKVLVNKLVDFGSLVDHVFKITRNGLGLDTTYSLDYVPTFDNEAILSKDMSAFNNFKIDKHSYWVKTADEINTFLTTGQFPQVAKAEATPVATEPTPIPSAQPTYTAPQTPVQPVEQAPVAENPTPTRTTNFKANW